MADNSDNNINCNWIGDGSEGGTINVDSEDNSSITFASATKGTPFNVRLDANDTASCYYEAHITSLENGSSLAVGLVTESGFLPGWKTRGCFYNGNITNGSAGLIIGFGKYIKEGDVVGVYQQRISSSDNGDTNNSNRQCNIIFYINGRCLGAGFSLADTNSEKYYPCLHVSGKATVKYSVPPSTPTMVFDREQEAGNEGDTYSGDWQIEQAFVGPELGELPLPEGGSRPFKVSLEKVESSSYRISVRIGNSISTAFTITGKMDEAFDQIELAQGCISTRMMPRPELRELEKLVCSALDHDGGTRKIIVSGDDGTLILTGPTTEIICSRYEASFEPVTSL